MLVEQNLKQIYFIVLFLLTFGTSTLSANPISEDNSDASIAPQISLNQENIPQLDNDPSLVGLWINSNIPCQPDSCSSFPRQMLILPDGTFLQGNSQLAESLHERNTANILNGEWKTANRMVYARANKSARWIPVFRYRIGDGKLLLTFQDGSREVWQKSY